LRLPDLLAHSVADARELFSQAGLPVTAQRLQSEIMGRLDALHTVGLGYVALDRSSPTLSRGEAQRVRLAVALTSRLEDLLHVLDEPPSGTPADVAVSCRLSASLQSGCLCRARPYRCSVCRPCHRPGSGCRRTRRSRDFLGRSGRSLECRYANRALFQHACTCAHPTGSPGT
jgi:hypothetical protein